MKTDCYFHYNLLQPSQYFSVHKLIDVSLLERFPAHFVIQFASQLFPKYSMPIYLQLWKCHFQQLIIIIIIIIIERVLLKCR